MSGILLYIMKSFVVFTLSLRNYYAEGVQGRLMETRCTGSSNVISQQCVQNLTRKPPEKTLLGGPAFRWEDNIKMNNTGSVYDWKN
jgi:hypothetical protein